MSDPASILPPNRTDAEVALEGATARLTDLPVPIRDLWNPATCPAALLGHLAWSLSVDDWHEGMSESIKRDVIAQSVALHRVKGTPGAVRMALGSLGFNVDLQEWFEYAGPPHTFEITAYGEDVFAAGFQIDAQLMDRTTRLIENVKPARSHFTLRIGESFNAPVYLRSGIRAAHIHRLNLEPTPRVHGADATTYLRTAHRARIIDEHEHIPAARRATASGSIYARSGSLARITSRITHFFQVREGAAYAV